MQIPHQHFDKGSECLGNMVLDWNFRLILRLVRLHDSEIFALPPAEWNEFLDMMLKKSELTIDESLPASPLGEVAVVLRDLDATKLGILEIRKLLYACLANVDSLRVPSLKTIGIYDRNLGSPIIGGSVLDPFACIINHACDPNVHWVNEGHELRIIALKDIAAGEELLRNYDPNLRDSSTRREDSWLHFAFDCKCQFCQQGPEPECPGPDHPMFENPRSILAPPVPSNDDYFRGLQKSCKDAIADLLVAFGWEAWPMMRLHYVSYQLHFCFDWDKAEMLKTWLKALYLIYPV
jgi:hypothetical protein